MELRQAIFILIEERDKRIQLVLSEDRVVADPVVEAIDVVLAELK